MLKFKMSALLSRAAFAVGVALCVTPIFTFAQSGDSSRMFNEVQAMRLEIAELRDMIERQQFELQKLKRAQAQGGSSTSSAPVYGAQSQVSQSQAVGQGQAYSVPQAPVSQPQTQSQGVVDYPTYSQNTGIQNPGAVDTASNVALATDNTGQPQFGTEPVSAVQTGPASIVSGQAAPMQAAPVQAAPQDDSSYYRPYPDTEQSQGAPVSSSVITAPAVQDTGYPPVVDRSVGSPAVATQYPEGNQSTVQNDYSVRQIQQVVPREVLNAQQPRYSGVASSASTPPNVASAPVVEASSATLGTGVVAVPGAVGAGQNTVIRAGQNAAGPQTTQTVPAPTPSQTIAGYSQQSNSQTPLSQPSVASPNPQPTQAAAAPALAETDFYQQGFNLLKQSKHQDAVGVFEQQIAAYPQGEYADDAYYWIAESKYVNRDLDQSKKNFKEIIDNFKQSPRLPDAMLKTAYIEQDQGNKLEAQLLLQEILQFHPRSNAAISAKNRLAEINN
jgi:tol-pal system protein YbgF